MKRLKLPNVQPLAFWRKPKTDNSQEVTEKVVFLSAYIRCLRMSGFELTHKVEKKTLEESCSYLFKALRHNRVYLTEAEEEQITYLMQQVDKAKVFN